MESVFVYVREAHPGEHYPHHDSFARKLAHANAFRDRSTVRRPILVDDVAGTAHRAFGRLPNMTYILGPSNRVVFRSDWTDPATVRTALEYLLRVRRHRREGLRLAPFFAEIEGARWVDQAAFDAGLAHNGPRAVAEFREAQRRWSRGERVGSLKR